MRQNNTTWQPIETALKTNAAKVHYILIGDGVCLPDIVTWKPARPERIVNGNRHLAVPEGWFTAAGQRSRHCGKATVWAPIPEYVNDKQ